MLMLAARLGLRSSDIIGMVFQNIKWGINKIELVQQKTGKSISLPLVNDVGDAIIDYLKVRPKYDSKYVFVRMQPPYSHLQSGSLYEIQRQDSHVVESIYLSYYVGEKLGDSVLLADRLYLTVPALEELDWLNKNKGRRMELVTLAKSNAIAYEEPPVRAPGERGRTRLKGKDVKLRNLFKERAGEFKTVTANIYGKRQEAKFLAIDLLWGKKLYRKMRFVLTVLGGTETILACTDTSFED